MHTCPECGQACACSGDLDDCLMDTVETYESCAHACGPEMDEEMSDFDDDGPSCRVCGCTDLQACPGGCIWAAPDLCSQCVEGRR